jgi:hypothetical protein
MIVHDPGHIYEIPALDGGNVIHFKFIKRGGGAIQYPEEWPGIQTQAVMRAVIDYLTNFPDEESIEPKTYELWQLGLNSPQPVTFENMSQVVETINVLIDRSHYLNGVLICIETYDAIQWLQIAGRALLNDDCSFIERCEDAAQCVRHALFSYEARAYRRKQEEVNRKQPEHDDSANPKPWRTNPYHDVPFNEDMIELRPIGPDGHIVLKGESDVSDNQAWLLEGHLQRGAGQTSHL